MIAASGPVIMVNLRPGGSNAGVLQMAGILATSLGASVIGVAALQPRPIDWTCGDYLPANFSGTERDEAEAAVDNTEAAFRAALPGHEVEWRSSLSFYPPALFVVDQVRRADLILTGAPTLANPDGERTMVNDLVMQAGRPVIIIPETPPSAALDRIMLAWKDTPQSRRAAYDSLPLLRRATHVTVVEVAPEESLPAARQRLADVAQWLAAHGIAADTLAAAALSDDAEQLETLALHLEANLIVAGAYGHSRVREWTFGGVTRSIMLRGNRCALLSH
jgi:nucleotide-binding universal stress UspA family protein